MSSVEAELAELRLTIEQAIAKFDILDKRISNETEEPEARQTETDPIFFRDQVDQSALIDRAEKYLNWGRLKSRILDAGNGLFANSCWNMCLDVYICDLKDQRVTVSAIAHSSGIPMTTAMRYINVMVEQGLLTKTPNAADNRMIFVSISDDCAEKIEELLLSAPF
ncbi:helix-turn-helix domain-containing protein [Parasphingorhabdus sp.]|uniref:helix-turn-helix domain-containing protein n=1 Tax=Parasphingorhabdus sp. TaxID=2709688 RepID=UPI0030011E7C